MVFDLKLTIAAIPKCGRCGKDMVLIKVVETETQQEADKHPGMLGSSQVKNDDEGEVKSFDNAYFTWRCTACGNIV